MTTKSDKPDHEKYPRRWVMGQGYVYDNGSYISTPGNVMQSGGEIPMPEKKEPKGGQ